jgi:hypothetical protein
VVFHAVDAVGWGAGGAGVFAPGEGFWK